MSFPDHHPEAAGSRVRSVRVQERAPTFGTNSRFLKTAILMACFVVSYVLLVFVAQTPLCALALAIVLGLSAAGIGFNIQHDGGHRAYSNHVWVNKLMAMTMDVLGGRVAR